MTTHETATLAADLVLVDEHDRVLLIRRGRDPHLGAWALPGGRVDTGETFRAAAIREAREETGIDLTGSLLATVGTYSDPDRDPRGRVVSTAFTTRLTKPVNVVAGNDASYCLWVDANRALDDGLAFDHDQILIDALHRLDDLRGLFEPEKRGFWPALLAALRFDTRAGGGRALSQIAQNRKAQQ